jgi:hypothetical protein
LVLFLGGLAVVVGLGVRVRRDPRLSHGWERYTVEVVFGKKRDETMDEDKKNAGLRDV